MQTEDYDFAVDLANTMDWSMATQDFEFMAMLEPEGCLVAFDGSKRIGIATCVGYGKLGWFGNLIVEPQYRKRGVGRQLVTYAVEYLQSISVKTVGLYAYPHLRGFYESLGFRADIDFALLKAENPRVEAAEELPRTGSQWIAIVEALDQACFGGDRKRLLESIIEDPDNRSFCIFDGTNLAGYVAATVYEHTAWIGPLIAQTIEAATALTNTMVSRLGDKTVYAVTPKDSPLHLALTSAGFSEEFSVTRMYLGQVTAKNCIYLAESLERG
ncbi:MAG: GNAT family N-acetyltransferase [Candidatus Bathyarchaeota archaeon]|nr:GNAT family N-acetyltransferase [Candidatus Bathyarchaeota archaeon]